MNRCLAAGAALTLTIAGTGCGLNVQAADLFMLTRAGPQGKLTLLVNDSGTISCDGRRARPLSDPLLLQARDLVNTLDPDAKANLRIRQPAGAVNRFTIRLADGTVSFPDRAAATHHELAQVELFALQAAPSACGPSGS